MGVRVPEGEAVKQNHTRLVMVPVKVSVEFNSEEGLYYASAPVRVVDNYARSPVATVRSGDKETAITEAVIAAGWSVPTEKSN